MKRFLTLMLTLILLTASVGAFAESGTLLLTSSDMDIDTDVISGGWAQNKTVDALKLDNREKQAFTKAAKKLVGTNLTAIATLGEQVVAGTNFCFLCYSSTTTNPPANSLCKVYVNQNTKGKAKITKIKTMKLKHAPSGGWVLSKTWKEAKVEDAAKKALKQALEDRIGGKYKPVMVLGRSAKEGWSWCLLCRTTTLPDYAPWLSVLYVKKSGKTYTIAGSNYLQIEP